MLDESAVEAELGVRDAAIAVGLQIDRHQLTEPLALRPKAVPGRAAGKRRQLCRRARRYRASLPAAARRELSEPGAATAATRHVSGLLLMVVLL
jgi:hypothetical protein